jgi:Helix-hairpin-helix domain
VGPALASRLLKQLGSVRSVVTADSDRLQQVRGVGPKKATRNLGYGDDAYFTALEHKVNEIVRLLNELPDRERRALTERIARLRGISECDRLGPWRLSGGCRRESVDS